MPRFDGTGPQAQCPRTGRGMGPCPPGAGPVGAPGPGGVVYGVGRGGRPRGGGRGRCWGGGRGGWAAPGGPAMPPGYAPPPEAGPVQYGPPPPQAEREMLGQQAEMLKNQLDAIQSRLEELQRDQ